MIRIVDGLYLGNRESARDLERLRQGKVTHIINCTDELPNYYEDHFTYLSLRLCDPDSNLQEHIPEVCAFIDEARKQGGQVLVHCFAGVSRSPTIVLCYLCHLGSSMEEAAEHLANIVWTEPDLMFLEQIAERFGYEYDEEDIQRIANVLVGRSMPPWQTQS